MGSQPKNKKNTAIITLSLLTLMLLSLSSCSEWRYYKQAVSGQLYILNHRIPIQRIIKSKETPDSLRTSLQQVLQIRKFAEHTLGLPVKDNYSRFVDLHRPYVVWNLVASKPLSFTPKQWCYPIIGCQHYRGYFKPEMATNAQNELKKEGWETWVGGVSAYSTLGWFEDPILNTFLKRDEASLAGLIFHELSHHIVYVKGDTTFNESFATAVELSAVKIWLSQQNHPEDIAIFQTRYDDRLAFIGLVTAAIEQLKKCYVSKKSAEEKQQEKSMIIEQLRKGYELAKKERPGLVNYAHWFSSPINNAKLLTVASYFQKVPAFTAMLQKHLNTSKDTKTGFTSFYKAISLLADQPKAKRDRNLNEYL